MSEHATAGPRPLGPGGDVDTFLEHWRQLHGGVDPRGTLLVRRWLTAVHACARPLARRGVRPDALTGAGLVVALVTVPVAALGGRWALVVAALTGASSVLDSLDGAVAVVSDRVTRWGALLDAVCDRIGDVALALALAALIVAPDEHVIGRWWLLVVTGCAVVLPLLHEYVRARAASLRLAGLDVVTAGERPTRLVVVLMFALAAGVTLDASWAWAGLCLVAASALAGTAQLFWRLRRSNA
ncbi:MAG TPA: CDP-alcohol phosphatidyltransferase family protein [Actinomycetales bacterium]|nr:CDP-alcohol phosphatidyltransferase family protein [Actinomycetales bacterium]